MTRRAICWPVTRPPLVREHRPRLWLVSVPWCRALIGPDVCRALLIVTRGKLEWMSPDLSLETRWQQPHNQAKPNGNGKVNKWIYFLQCCFVTCSCKLAPREFLAAWKLVFNLTIFSSRYKAGRPRPFFTGWLWDWFCVFRPIITDLFWSNNDKCEANEDGARRGRPRSGMVTDGV